MAKKKIYDIRPPRRKRPFSLGGEGSLWDRLPGADLDMNLGFLRKLIPGKRFFSFWNLAILGLGALTAGFLYLHFSAHADVKVFPKTNPLSFKKEARAEAELMQADYEEGVIKAQILSREKEISDTFSSTGVSETATRAGGTVKVINEYHAQQILVKNTRFLSADSKLFYSQERVVVPSGGTKEVEVRAAEPGPDYNIKPTSFSIPGLLGSPRYTSVYAESSEEMKGGSVGETAQITEKDLDKAEDELLSRAREQMKDEFSELAGSSFELLEDTVQVELVQSSSSAEEGMAVDDFEFTVRVKGKGLSFHRGEAEKLAEKWIADKIGEDEGLKSGTQKVSVSAKAFDLEKGEAELKFEAEAEVVKRIDLEKVEKALAGKKIKEIRGYFSSHPRVDKVEIDISPFWVTRIPSELDRIESGVVVE